MSANPWDQPTEMFPQQAAPPVLRTLSPTTPMTAPAGASEFTIAAAPEEYDDEPETLADGRQVPSWVVSLLVHVGVILALTLIKLPEDFFEDFVITTPVEDVDPDTYKFATTVVDQVGSDSDVNMLSPSQAAAAQMGRDPQKQMEQQLENELLTVEVPVTDDIPEPNEADILERVERTGSTEHPGGVSGSMDRITLELAGALKDKKTLVAWVFDRSPSVNKRRDAIAQRFENVYKQLGMLKVDKAKALKTAVAVFGDRPELLTPDPIDDISEIVDIIRNIEPDSSGKEAVFAAVEMVAKKFLSYRQGGNRRNFLIIVVTDEAGSDQQRLETVIKLTKRYGIKVYVVGNAAPFGRKTIEIPWEYEGEMIIAELEPGPETIAPERLRLPFWTVNETDLKEMSSGYGPYALTRLCAETGGMYLITQDTSGPHFDPSVMRNYHPSYDPVRAYQREIASNVAKKSLIEAAMRLQVKNIRRPPFAFDAPNDNVLRIQITEAQKPAAETDERLKRLVAHLEQGEKDRQKISDARWRANYDLALGRSIAMRVRVFGYNSVLANMKSSPLSFKNKDSNKWRLAPSREIKSGPAVRKLAKKATEYLTRVMDEHPGTPWAILAERELSQPMGWEWKESRVAAATTGQRNGPAAKEKARLLLAEEEKKKQKRKKMGKKPIPKKIQI